jgi:argininosuccinate lyase
MHNVGYMDTEDVEFENYRPLFDALTHVDEALPTMQALLEVMQPDRELMSQRAARGFSSVTALAEAIQTREKISYRSAHRVVARAVLMAVERGRDATGIDAALLNDAARETLGRELALDAIGSVLDPRQFVEHHAGIGATAPGEVRRMLANRRETLARAREEVAGRRKRLESAKKLLQSAADALTRA